MGHGQAVQPAATAKLSSNHTPRPTPGPGGACGAHKPLCPPFRPSSHLQVPRYCDGEVDICQSEAILRYLGRKHNMYGKGIAEAAAIDEVRAPSTSAPRPHAMCAAAHSPSPTVPCPVSLCTRPQVMDGSRDLGDKFLVGVAFKAKEEPNLVPAFFDKHVAPASLKETGVAGAHAGFLARLLAKSSSGFFMPSGFSIAGVRGCARCPALGV